MLFYISTCGNAAPDPLHTHISIRLFHFYLEKRGQLLLASCCFILGRPKRQRYWAIPLRHSSESSFSTEGKQIFLFWFFLTVRLNNDTSGHLSLCIVLPFIIFLEQPVWVCLCVINDVRERKRERKKAL
jgi:hypothetical protein